ncbi:hypothetical protein AB0F88_30545 [Streptosporangium sp. NPDC023963]|uniref:hypothetical protein n=1 Tax=Streptosporangium sp. NPDC023963 TaxID=3155608 RepID=UPI0034225DFF
MRRILMALAVVAAFLVVPPGTAQAAPPTGLTTVISRNGGKCVDVSSGSKWPRLVGAIWPGVAAPQVG